MSLLKGSISFKSLYLLAPAAVDLRDRMFAKPVLADEDVTATPALGFFDVKEIAGYNYARVRMSQRRVPAAVVRDQVETEIAALVGAGTKVNKKTKTEIREDIMARLLPTTPVSHTDTEIVWKTGDRVMYVAAVSNSAIDRVVAQVFLVQCQCVVASAEGTATSAMGADAAKALPGVDLGAEFLTWLWCEAETCYGAVGDITAGVTGPMKLTHDDAAAHTLVLKGDCAPVSPEAGSALKEGKLLVSTGLALARGGDAALAQFDSGFGVRGLRVAAEPNDPQASFQVRVLKMQEWRENVETLLRYYLEHRDTELEAMKKWVEEK